MPRVTFAGQDKEAEVAVGASIRQAAKAAGVCPYSGVFKLDNCHGLGLCGECRVRVIEGEEHLTEPGLRERHAGRPRGRRSVVKRGNEEGERLGCQALVLGDVVVQPRLRDEG